MWRKAMVYLGLGDDAEYEDYRSEPDDDFERPTRERAPRPHVSSGAQTLMDEPSGIGTVRPITSRGHAGEQVGQPRSEPSTLRPQQNPTRPRAQTVVRPVAVTPNAKPQVVMVTVFNQAQDVADRYKSNIPVVVNLHDADRELARRLIDFASGLCYGIGGKMERLEEQVYLLKPTNVEVSAEERRRLEERGFQA